jgi:hypothetical protein
MRPDQGKTAYYYLRGSKRKISDWHMKKDYNKRGQPNTEPFRKRKGRNDLLFVPGTVVRYHGKKTPMVMVGRAHRTARDAHVEEEQLHQAGTTDTHVRGYTVTIPGDRTKTGRPLKCKYYAVYARQAPRIGPKIQRFF